MFILWFVDDRSSKHESIAIPSVTIKISSDPSNITVSSNSEVVTESNESNSSITDSFLNDLKNDSKPESPGEFKFYFIPIELFGFDILMSFFYIYRSYILS